VTPSISSWSFERIASQASHVSPPLGPLQNLLTPSCGRRPSRILRWMRRRRDSWSIVASRVAAAANARQIHQGLDARRRQPVRPGAGGERVARSSMLRGSARTRRVRVRLRTERNFMSRTDPTALTDALFAQRSLTRRAVQGASPSMFRVEAPAAAALGR